MLKFALFLCLRFIGAFDHGDQTLFEDIFFFKFQTAPLAFKEPKPTSQEYIDIKSPVNKVTFKSLFTGLKATLMSSSKQNLQKICPKI